MPESPNIQTELTSIESMTPSQLRAKYLQTFGEHTRSGNRRFLIKRIAWRLQANAEGDLPERLRRLREKALTIARDSDLRTTTPRPRNPRSPRPGQMVPQSSHDILDRTVERTLAFKRDQPPTPGTQLTRIYKGRTVVVTVLHDGFEHDGTKYGSLSGVAKAITGTHISGHAFFKLTPRKDTSK